MEKTILKLIVSALALGGLAYGAYKLYEKYAGAKLARKGKFREGFEDMGYNFDDDEYLEDDDVYYFGEDDDDNAEIDIDTAETAETAPVEGTTDIDVAETAEAFDTSDAEDIENASLDDLFRKGN
ncbi:MAG: hypothetical protein LBS74_02335 [Oscillospiraceae bacterium]|jgi:hypothetical protein|nr:hypothetical protein [Oscillospiraceae bacterium]